MDEDASSNRRRALRYSLQAPVRFRTAGGEWMDGVSLDVSHLGLLFHTFAPVPALSSSLRLRVTLPRDGGGAGALVTCIGRVVRTCSMPHSSGGLIAVEIGPFRLCRAHRGERVRRARVEGVGPSR